MKAAVIVYPGSNCDRDMFVAVRDITGKEPEMVWHQESSLPSGLDLILLPGGFTYGDYLRCGAIAAKSPIMKEIIAAAEKGTHILGVCNGFQVLVETGILPGALMRNHSLQFICKDVYLKPENTDTPFTKQYSKDQAIRIPIAHHDGNYVADEKTLTELEENDQIAFRYVNENGQRSKESNPNGSQQDIAGIFNRRKTILGMMPHPERAVNPLNGGDDGVGLFKSLLETLG